VWKQYFLLDPIFPKRLLKAGYKRTLDFINSLFEDYSKRDLSHPTDRAIAISGLQTRVARTLNSQGNYGTLEIFLGRNLLWQRCSEKKMERIIYKDSKVPSWSWTAYLGGIKFISVSFDPEEAICWHKDLRFDDKQKDTLIGSLGKFWNCTIEQKNSQHAILDSQGTERGWLQFDVKDSTNMDLHRCVVIGRTGRESEIKYYILVVQLTRSKREYERVGVGLIWASHISKLEDNVRIV
jgi:hypothetical protein